MNCKPRIMEIPRGGYILLSLVLMWFYSCRKEELQKTTDHAVYEAVYKRSGLDESDAFALHNQNLLTKPLPEASGIVSGRINKGLVYIHEDSGNRPVVFVYDTLGAYLGDLVLVGATNRDWEDIAIGPGPVEGLFYIYIADIGDNRARREEVRILRFAEPTGLSALDRPFTINIDDFETIVYQYPEGPRDAETLMIDPATKDLIVVTKRDVNVHVYKLPFPQKTDGFAEIWFKGQLPLRTIVGGDISPNGKEILLKDYGSIYHWEVKDDPVEALFAQPPVKVAYIPEVQGEAVGWSYNGDGYFTTTETDNHAAEPWLYYYVRK